MKTKQYMRTNSFDNLFNITYSCTNVITWNPLFSKTKCFNVLLNIVKCLIDTYTKQIQNIQIYIKIFGSQI